MIVDVPRNNKYLCKAKCMVIEWVPKIIALIGGVKPEKITLVAIPDPGYPAATLGDKTTYDSNYIDKHPDDYGVVIHETVHIIQKSVAGPTWLVEGIADWVRYFNYEKDDGRAAKCSYKAGYMTAARMLAAVEKAHPGFIKIISDLMRKSEFHAEQEFKTRTGKTPSEWYLAVYGTKACKELRALPRKSTGVYTIDWSTPIKEELDAHHMYVLGEEAHHAHCKKQHITSGSGVCKFVVHPEDGDGATGAIKSQRNEITFHGGTETHKMAKPVYGDRRVFTWTLKLNGTTCLQSLWQLKMSAHGGDRSPVFQMKFSGTKLRMTTNPRDDIKGLQGSPMDLCDAKDLDNKWVRMTFDFKLHESDGYMKVKFTDASSGRVIADASRLNLQTWLPSLGEGRFRFGIYRWDTCKDERTMEIGPITICDCDNKRLSSRAGGGGTTAKLVFKAGQDPRGPMAQKPWSFDERPKVASQYTVENATEIGRAAMCITMTDKTQDGAGHPSAEKQRLEVMCDGDLRSHEGDTLQIAFFWKYKDVGTSGKRFNTLMQYKILGKSGQDPHPPFCFTGKSDSIVLSTTSGSDDNKQIFSNARDEDKWHWVHLTFKIGTNGSWKLDIYSVATPSAAPRSMSGTMNLWPSENGRTSGHARAQMGIYRHRDSSHKASAKVWIADLTVVKNGAALTLPLKKGCVCAPKSRRLRSYVHTSNWYIIAIIGVIFVLILLWILSSLL